MGSARPPALCGDPAGAPEPPRRIRREGPACAPLSASHCRRPWPAPVWTSTALPRRRGTVGLSLAPGVLLQVLRCQLGPAPQEPAVLCSGTRLVCVTASRNSLACSLLGPEGHLEGIRTGPEWQFDSSHAKLGTFGVGYGSFI